MTIHMRLEDHYSLAYLLVLIDKQALDEDKFTISRNKSICDCSIDDDGLSTCIIMAGGEFLHLDKDEIDTKIEELFSED